MDSITDKIWIGNYLDAKDRAALKSAGIRSILCLDGCIAGRKADELGVQRVEVVELIDGSGKPCQPWWGLLLTLHAAASLLTSMSNRYSPGGGMSQQDFEGVTSAPRQAPIRRSSGKSESGGLPKQQLAEARAMTSFFNEL